MKRIAFWGAVGLVSIGANYALGAVAARFPNSAFAHFNALAKKG